jgi:hypothetical protein
MRVAFVVENAPVPAVDERADTHPGGQIARLTLLAVFLPRARNVRWPGISARCDSEQPCETQQRDGAGQYWLVEMRHQ